MNSILGQAGSMPEMSDITSAPITQNPFISPTSMSPTAVSNVMGSPLANEGANMNHYMGAMEHMFPEMGKASGSGMAGGGLVSFADGGMPGAGMDPMQGPALGQQGMGAAGDLEQKVEQIFQQHLQDPKMIGQALLQLLQDELKKALSPEELAQLQTPEGEEMLAQLVQQIMSQMGGGGGGGLGQMAGAGGGGAGQAGMPATGALGQMAGAPQG